MTRSPTSRATRPGRAAERVIGETQRGGAADDPDDLAPSRALPSERGPADPVSGADRWRQERRATADAHAEALRNRQRAESARARAMLLDLVARATVQGPAPVPLRARSFDGRHRYRTALHGWYLRRDESLAVSTEGDFYVLRAPSSLSALWRGVDLTPQDPPLVLGAGGKDGESLDLDVAVARVLGTS